MWYGLHDAIVGYRRPQCTENPTVNIFYFVLLNYNCVRAYILMPSLLMLCHSFTAALMINMSSDTAMALSLSPWLL